MFNKNTILISVGILSSTLCFAENDKIPIVIPPTNAGADIHHPHSPLRPLAEGYYDLETDKLVLNFNYDWGTCLITVSNSAGESTQQLFETSFGTLVMPLSGEPGLYSVSILSEGGVLVSTQFLLI